jgi:murein DD-endopeptidase MepM/ murein hydrolase activator NlpD
MHIIRLSNFCSNSGADDLLAPRILIPLLLAVAMVGGVAFWAGRQTAVVVDTSVPDSVIELVAEEKRLSGKIRAEAQAHLDALALRVANLQAQLMRLNALGERLVQAGKLDAKEFDFDSDPAQGGSGVVDDYQSQDVAEITGDMARLSQVLEDRERKLELLEHLLMNRELKAEVLPSGRPILKGWVASDYGKRTDPFTGKKGAHHGIDFAGISGSEVMSVAGGVVTRSEKVSGYGNLIELKHADGLTTRYAHNKDNLVQTGDVVKKGQVIALLGSTGKSTGPHVHFEVRREGRPLDPREFSEQD